MAAMPAVAGDSSADLQTGNAVAKATAALTAIPSIKTPPPAEAKKVFGTAAKPSGQSAQAIGNYIRGCLSGATALSRDGNGWQTMRVSRNRVWGHPRLVGFIEKLARDVRGRDGWRGVLVGDMSQPLGGPMMSGHASHQIGLDVDIWYTQMPSYTLSVSDREKLAAENVVDKATLAVNRVLWTEGHERVLKRAASYPEVARIFVHPAIKKAICDNAGADRAWLQKVRPWWKHDDHFHVRLSCPEGSPACVEQKPLLPDDGCGKELDNWFKILRAAQKAEPVKPSPPGKPVLMTDMPKECQTLAGMPPPEGTPVTSGTDEPPPGLEVSPIPALAQGP